MSVELALIGTGLGLGLRHGIDWDHIAAIADVTGTETSRGKAARLGTSYALGHASVVVALGLLALLAGSTLPQGLDGVMEVVVGVTLVSLGVWLLYSMWRHGAEYRLRSRWMLVSAGVRGLTGRVRTRLGLRGHRHDPRHNPRGSYGPGAAYGIGMLHGVGAETGSQVLLFAAAAGATSTVAGTLLLFAFVAGLLMSNSLITLGSVYGLWGARSNRVAYLAIGLATAVFSIVVGVLFLLSRSSILPPFLA